MKNTRRALFAPPAVLLLSLLLPSLAHAQAEPFSRDTVTPAEAGEVVSLPQPPPLVVARDAPDDPGGHVLITWEPSPDEARGTVDAYEIQRGDALQGPFSVIGSVSGGNLHFDDGDVLNGRPYYYRITAMSVGEGPGAPSSVSEAAIPRRQWFHTGRLPLFVSAILLGGAVLWFVMQARKGKDLYIRKIAGLEAVDEAVGRATEMGRKIYYVPGTQDMDNVQTIAGVTILGRVARLTAEYEAHLEVPVARSMVMITAREVVKEAYLNAGRPDSFREDNIYYLTDDQFGYAAGIDGLVVRERPATIFYMGAFYAESLILVETGNSINAIQIAGTAQPSQLPFFVAACDYTLIGEELFAASAYLSREPRLLGSLKGQDVGKLIILLALLIGVVWQTLYIGFGIDALGDFARFFVSD